ncbi:response regulator transcription factor [Streptomyces sp. NPDC018019]|uniref:response regulator transcription factor n=1 Tax=Streptomyces sp. NPDC018019 TaxID=3365030 RepID=UPI00379FF8B4
MHHFYTGDDPWLPADLLWGPLPAAAVDTCARGGGRRQRPARRMLAAYGMGCHLRLVLHDARGVWGMLGLWRAEGAKPFGDTDLWRAADLGPALVAFLRTYVTAAPLAARTPVLAPGVLVVGADHTIRAATPQAYAWQQRLSRCARAPQWTGAAFMAGLAVHTRAHARNPQATAAPLVVGPAASHGRWTAVHGQPLCGTGSDRSDPASADVAIVIETAHRDQVLPSFCDWFGITARERQVLARLCEATAPKQIARRLGLSVHTVNDHPKSVFRKTGATGREELPATLA